MLLRSKLNAEIVMRSKNHVFTNRLQPNVDLAEPVLMRSKMDVNKFETGQGRDRGVRALQGQGAG